jgi:hypothetical protein
MSHHDDDIEEEPILEPGTYIVRKDRADVWFPKGERIRVGAAGRVTGRAWTGQEMSITHEPDELEALADAVSIRYPVP